LQVPGDPRNNYIARMNWAGTRTRSPVAAQPASEFAQRDHRQRSQRSGPNHSNEKDDAWVDIDVEDILLADGQRFLVK
jgi:hypothetical protein